MIRTLIVDDEPPARKKVRHLLRPFADVEIVAEAGTGAEAIAAADRHKPDLILLDIHLPDMDGFGVLEGINDRDARESAVVIFVTAYDEHALAAFNARALDYLLKPVAPDRFEAAIERARKLLAPATAPDASAGAGAGAAPHGRYARRFLVEKQEAAVFVAVDAIAWFEAARNYVLLHTRRETFIMRSTLDAVQDRLDPEQFARVNRSAIVNVDAIQELQPWTNGEYRIRLKDAAATELMWTRRFVSASLQTLLGR
jgi:two-component system LytT family response regulator